MRLCMKRKLAPANDRVSFRWPPFDAPTGSTRRLEEAIGRITLEDQATAQLRRLPPLESWVSPTASPPTSEERSPAEPHDPADTLRRELLRGLTCEAHIAGALFEGSTIIVLSPADADLLAEDFRLGLLAQAIPGRAYQLGNAAAPLFRETFVAQLRETVVQRYLLHPQPDEEPAGADAHAETDLGGGVQTTGLETGPGGRASQGSC